MELDTILAPWIQQLEAAFKPYPVFLEQVIAKLTELEKEPSSLAATKSEHELLNRELQAQVIVLKTALSEANHALSGSQAEVASLNNKISLLLNRSGSEASSRATASDASAEAGNKRRSLSSQNSDIRSNSGVRENIPALPARLVLLVDDAEINRVLMSHYFKGLPVKLDFAVSIQAAVQKCKERKFDLVVVDDELQDLENTEFKATGLQVVGLSNKGASSGFAQSLNRGQSRDQFVQQLKSYLWKA